MTNPISPFEEKLRAAVQMPQPSKEFQAQLRKRLMIAPSHPLSLVDRLEMVFRRPLRSAMMFAFLLFAGLFAANPTSVMAAMRELIGYIPGAGIVDTSVPIRVLAEPVTMEKDGVSIEVSAAVLSESGTHIAYRVSGVPESAYAAQPGSACVAPDYLRLPDGKRLDHQTDAFWPNPLAGNFSAVPADVNEAMWVIPCILNTQPDSVPENWEIPLEFVPAPADFTVMPVEDVPAAPAQDGASQEAQSANDGPETPMEASAVRVDRVITSADGYILIGRLQLPDGETSIPSADFEIQDANGNLIEYTHPYDIRHDPIPEGSNDIPWLAQFNTGDVTYPLTISFPMITLTHPDPSASVEFEFDAGTNPQVGQELGANQQVQLLGHTLQLVSLKANSRNGYDFTFQSDADVFGATLQIEGYPSMGILGGGNEGETFERNLAFSAMPSGKLNAIVSDLILIERSVTYQGQWSPDGAAN